MKVPKVGQPKPNSLGNVRLQPTLRVSLEWMLNSRIVEWEDRLSGTTSQVPFKQWKLTIWCCRTTGTTFVFWTPWFYLFNGPGLLLFLGPLGKRAMILARAAPCCRVFGFTCFCVGGRYQFQAGHAQKSCTCLKALSPTGYADCSFSCGLVMRSVWTRLHALG